MDQLLVFTDQMNFIRPTSEKCDFWWIIPLLSCSGQAQVFSISGFSLFELSSGIRIPNQCSQKLSELEGVRAKGVSLTQITGIIPFFKPAHALLGGTVGK